MDVSGLSAHAAGMGEAPNDSRGTQSSSPPMSPKPSPMSGIRQCGALFLPFEYLIKRWETMSTQPRYLEISSALDKGVKSLQKWSHRVDTTSNAYFICLVLEPNVKDRYFLARWEDE
ncbi:hypothetical protein DFH09DRAFT_571091 [Mycena vulgaris]|nr:hypothetical protein DFH09DRAFT_571091 [Mycena vulgaris]